MADINEDDEKMTKDDIIAVIILAGLLVVGLISGILFL